MTASRCRRLHTVNNGEGSNTCAYNTNMCFLKKNYSVYNPGPIVEANNCSTIV